ncbi:MAG: RDD family protein [Planctomycetota bacterium]|nr:RDD family protein [Planctomycetota bacterium]
MRKPALSFLILFTLALLRITPAWSAPSPATAPDAAISGSAAPRALLAHADDEHFWIARVTTATGDQGAYDQTDLMSRGHGDTAWTPLPTISSRAVSLASSAGELFVVLSNGQCMIVDDQDLRLAPGLPQGGAMVAIANDQDALWAIMLVNSPTTDVSSAQPRLSAPTTFPSTEPSTPQRRLMVYRLDAGNWVDARELPPELSDPLPAFSIAVVDQRPILAWQSSSGPILVSRLTADHVWSKPMPIVSLSNSSDFKLLCNARQPMLWTAADASTGNARNNATSQPSLRGSAGMLYGGPNFSRPIPLRVSSSSPTAGVQTIEVAFGYLRWLATADHKTLFEQAYKFDGQPVDVQQPVAGMTSDAIPVEPYWIAALALILLATGSAMMQRRFPNEDSSPPARPDARPFLAPLGVRFAAGLVDLVPFVAVLALAHKVAPNNIVPPADLPALIQVIVLAALTYVVHTTIAEVICGQSIGKMLLGLRVVGADGKPVTHSTLALRNVLRIVDVFPIVPLLMIVFSPLHQRFGDLPGGTIVIAREPEPEEHPE